MSKAGLIALGGLVGVVCVLALTLGVSFKSGDQALDPKPQSTNAPVEHPTESRDENGFVRYAFLNGLDLAAEDHGYAVMLHPLATGGEQLVITDPDSLRAAQSRAYYTDDPNRATKLTLLSILFLSPAGMPPDTTFISILKNKEEVARFRCHPPYCRGEYEAETPHSRDFAGLLDAAQPVEYVTDRFDHPDEARAAHFRALKDPEIVQIIQPSLPAPNTVIYDHRVMLGLPVILLETDESGTESIKPFDEADFMARFTAAFTHVFPQTEAYRLGPLNTTIVFPPHHGWLVVSDKLDGTLKSDNGSLRGLDGIMAIEASIAVDLTSTMAETLLGDDPFERMPAFALTEPESLAQRLDALAEEVLGQPCPGCFQIELPVSTVDKIRVRKLKPRTYDLSYFRVVTP